jgi:hypothetical protein
MVVEYLVINYILENPFMRRFQIRLRHEFHCQVPENRCALQQVLTDLSWVMQQRLLGE